MFFDAEASLDLTSNTKDYPVERSIGTSTKYVPSANPFFMFHAFSSLDLMGGLLRNGLLLGMRRSTVSRGGEGKVHEMARNVGQEEVSERLSSNGLTPIMQFKV